MFAKMICAFVFFLYGCTPHSDDVIVDELVENYFHQTTTEQVRQFGNHTLEEKYRLFLYGNQIVHPPAIYLAESFAAHGASVVPFLKEKLKTAKEELTIRDIAAVLSEVAYLKLYDFSKDPELMELLERRVNNMKGIWKDIVIESVLEIRSAKSCVGIKKSGQSFACREAHQEQQ